MTVQAPDLGRAKHLPTYLDRYPAKMVAKLADKLVSKYTTNCTRLMDPFCGSGAILAAGKEKKISVTGFDINPYAVLLSSVKLNGFDKETATELCSDWIDKTRTSEGTFSIHWPDKYYWFTEATLRKYEGLRHVAKRMDLYGSRDGRAALLAYALSIRRCSRADQRSPKPFISRSARERRRGVHFDPLKETIYLLDKLSELYGTPSEYRSNIVQLNFATADKRRVKKGNFSHVITSPPYINAQDYFRNSKLELYLLEGLLPFSLCEIKNDFIGTERGRVIEPVPQGERELHRSLSPELTVIEKTHPRLGAVIHRYLYDMGRSFDMIKHSLTDRGVLVIVCGDNLVGGYGIPTWRLLNRLLEMRGFELFDSFGDQIDRRAVAPKRNGHKGLIKEEVVSAFRLKSK